MQTNFGSCEQQMNNVTNTVMNNPAQTKKVHTSHMSKNKKEFVCPRCSRIFNRKDNLQRHVKTQIHCAHGVALMTEQTTISMMNTLLHVANAPLQIDEMLKHADDTYEIRILCDVWRSVECVCDMHMKQNESTFDTLLQLFRLLSTPQLHILFGRIMQHMYKPNEAMIDMLREVYKYIKTLQSNNVPTWYSHKIPDLIKVFFLLPEIHSVV